MKSKTIKLSELSKAQRWDAKYHLHIYPKVKNFMMFHSISSDGRVIERQRPIHTGEINKLSTNDICLIYALIKYHDAYKTITKSIDSNRAKLDF
jgi:hypothetical protein